MHSLNSFMANFYLQNPTIKDFACSRIPYHYEQAHMYQELISYLRSLESRYVSRADRQEYMRVRNLCLMKELRSKNMFLSLFRDDVVQNQF